ncbi:hypothetical protein BI081_gp152 [Mycobacterium phage Tonenili]|uniref:Uncharacterized protein n=1 Tax=Mycobacterium phage Tonenili TaxID=1891703 RepID=A0A1C9EHH4_9CAUD|nr:hypothetical protein BI081_gp152 [Mycobacterium phage Tonenili]AON96955.1 hypothetical protein SEA_TONENILI_235 [Mycobacterium phage Tonenili]
MRVYVTIERMACEYDEVKEVFVNEQDAKNWVAQHRADDQREFMSYDYVPRELRTAWRG